MLQNFVVRQGETHQIASGREIPDAALTKPATRRPEVPPR